MDPGSNGVESSPAPASTSSPPPPPQKPHISRSFSRLEDAAATQPSRTGVEVLTAANTSLEVHPLQLDEDAPLPIEKDNSQIATSDGNDGTQEEEPPEPHGEEHEVTPANLPVELVELIDRFIDSLSKKTYTAPVSVDNLSSLFQDFYLKASSVAFQVASNTYAPRDSVRARAKEQQMISISEMSQKKSQRKLVELKAKAFEECIEESITQRLYEKIWRHKSADDEARDLSLKSKTMALSVVGVGLKEFGLDKLLDHEDLAPVTEALELMDAVHFPRGKILELKKAHKLIVDCLSSKKGNPEARSMSADQILPALIYSIMISPPEINPISNLLFIQRFRAQKAVDGETAYCLTNFEAAIAFLETVDLDSLLRQGNVDDELGVNKIYPSTKNEEPTHREGRARPESGIIDPLDGNWRPSVPSTSPKPASAKLAQTPPPPTPSRRTPFLAPVEFATSAASSAVNTADQSIKTIGLTLESSYKFLLGKMSDRKTEVPRTLDDARKLVGTPAEDPVNDNQPSSGPLAPPAAAESGQATSFGNSVTLPFGLLGTAMQRVSSSDSIRSKGSASSSANPVVKPSPKLGDHDKLQVANPLMDRGSIATPVNVAAESVRNIGNHLGRLAGNMNVIRGPFSRSQSSPQPQPVSVNDLEAHSPAAPPIDLLNTFPDLANALVTDGSSSSPLPRIAPPDPRFLTVDPEDLKIGEIPNLLKEYRRLAEYLDKFGLFSGSG